MDAQFLLTSTHGAVVIVTEQTTELFVNAPPHMLVAVTMNWSVIVPQNPAGTVFVAVKDCDPPLLKLPPTRTTRLLVVGLPTFGVKMILSVTLIPTSGTFPQFVTKPVAV